MGKLLKTLFATIILACSFIIADEAFANNKSTATLDGGELINGRTLVPLRSIFEEIGAIVHWDAKTNKITATKDNRKIILTVGSKHTYVNGKHVVIDVPAQTKNGRTLVPLRFISESFGGTAKWDPIGSRAYIYVSHKEVLVNVNRTDQVQVNIDRYNKQISVNGIKLGSSKQQLINRLGQGKIGTDEMTSSQTRTYKIGNKNVEYLFNYSNSFVEAISFNINSQFRSESWFKSLGKPFANKYGIIYYYVPGAYGSEHLLMIKPEENRVYVVYADNNFYYAFGMYDKVW